MLSGYYTNDISIQVWLKSTNQLRTVMDLMLQVNEIWVNRPTVWHITGYHYCTLLKAGVVKVIKSGNASLDHNCITSIRMS